MSKAKVDLSLATIETLLPVLLGIVPDGLPKRQVSGMSLRSWQELRLRHKLRPKDIARLVGETAMVRIIDTVSISDDDLILCLTIGPVVSKSAWLKLQPNLAQSAVGIRQALAVVDYSLRQEIGSVLRRLKVA